jgi:hypothetical protein
VYELFEWLARADGRRRPGHQLLDARLAPAFEGGPFYDAEDDPGPVDAHADVLVAHPPEHVHRVVAIPAGRHVAEGVGSEHGPAVPWQAEREPVVLPADVVVHLGEAEGLEPPRGPWAHVSGVVAAVHDHGPVALELVGAILEVPERDVDRPRMCAHSYCRRSSTSTTCAPRSASR